MEKKPIKISLKVGIVLSIIAIIVCSIALVVVLQKLKNNDTNNYTKKDDWEFDSKKVSENRNGFFSGIAKGISPSSITGSASLDSAVASESTNGGTIGFSTGGAKDINNFRENIKNGYFPISTDITYNGLFYDYTFDTGVKEESKELFSPSYSTAVSKDPISNKNELYMTVGLNSNIKQSDFKRKKLNLTVVLDISGSMSSGFNSYYYDQFTGKEQENSEDSKKTKMQIANESVNVLLDQLNDDDRFGMVLFDDQSYLGKPISLIRNTDVNAIKNHILEIEANGGTGIYYFPLREEFKLENPEWKYDIWPEFMDGKNVFDFVDKDILKKVEALEREEEEILQKGDKGLNMDNDEDMNDGEESSELSEDLIEAHDKLMQDLKTIKERHKLVKRSKLPSRLIGESATDKFMAEVRPDLKEKAEKVKLLSQKMRREQKDKVRNNLKKDAGIEEEDMEDSDEMDIEDEDKKIVKKKKISEKESEKIKHEKNKIVQK